jgi:hypothetical protein
MAPRVLADQLAPYAPDYAAICAGGERTVAIRWRGEWLGARSSSESGNIRAALCLRLRPVPGRPRWVNLLRDWRVAIEQRNVALQSGSPNAVRDGRVLAGGALDTFWWATAKDPNKPLTLEFDLQGPRPVYWIEMLHAEAAGFSAHFNLRRYTWQTRPSPSSNWTDVAQSPDDGARGDDRARGDNRASSTRHLFPEPVAARWWRLVIPPPSDQLAAPLGNADVVGEADAGAADVGSGDPVYRLAEIQFWTVEVPGATPARPD